MRTEQITCFVCEICGAQYSDQRFANICESQGAEELKFNVGDFCLLEKEIPTKIFWFTKRPAVVLGQIVLIELPAVSNPRPPRQFSGGTHEHLFHIRLDNFNKPLSDVTENMVSRGQDRLLPINQIASCEGSLPSVYELRRALWQYYYYGHR